MKSFQLLISQKELCRLLGLAQPGVKCALSNSIPLSLLEVFGFLVSVLMVFLKTGGSESSPRTGIQDNKDSDRGLPTNSQEETQLANTNNFSGQLTG